MAFNFKRKNSKNMSPKQNIVRRRNTFVKISMDSCAIASIIHKSFVNLKKKYEENLHEYVVRNGGSFFHITQG